MLAHWMLSSIVDTPQQRMVERALVIIVVILLTDNPRGKVSFADSCQSERTCLRSLDDIREAFLNYRWTKSFCEHSIFTFYPEKAKSYTVLAIFFRNTARDALANDSQMHKCCDPEQELKCTVLMRYRTHLFKEWYPPLLKMLAFPFELNAIFKAMRNIREENKYKETLDKYGWQKYCWNMPPFCNDNEFYDTAINLLKEFTRELPHLVLNGKEGPIEVGPIETYKPHEESWKKKKEDMKGFTFGEERAALGAIVVLSFIVTVPILLLLLTWYEDTLNIVLIKSTLAAECMYTGMIHSWIWLGYLYMHKILMMIVLYNYVTQFEQTDKFMYNLLMQDVVTQPTLFAILNAIILVELPFLFVHFWRSAMIKGVYRNKGSNKWLIRVRKVAESLGWYGIVIACQFSATCIIYTGVFLFINPLYTIMQVIINFVIIALSAVLTLAIGVTCISCCKTCSLLKLTNLFIITTVIIIIGCISYIMRDILPDLFHHDESITMIGLMSSVMSSGILALFGYVCKKTIWNKISEEVCEFDIRHQRTHPPESRDPPTPMNPFVIRETYN